VTYRDECLVRLDVARARMDDALLRAPDATALHDAWHEVLRELMQERPPEQDQTWLADRLLDLKLHVYNSPRWRQSLESVEAVMQSHPEE
jgi:hypothetical protein